ncbi:MAG: DUF1996 domain-containing protein [Actinomycetota bacterium]
MRKYGTLALVFVVVASAAGALLSSRRADDQPYGSVELGSGEARPAGLIEDLFAALTPGAPATPTPTSPPPGYEPVEPGDRIAAGEPDTVRLLMGTFDGGQQGLFASYCSYTHSLPDDPIVFPSQPGGSHLHDFFGATGTDAYSTDDSLRNTESTCNYPGDSASYWVPALYEDGQRTTPNFVGAYYTAGGKNHRTIEPFPKGLKLVVRDTENWTWYCLSGATMAHSFSKGSPSCPSGEHLGLEIRFPDCWDGMYLDVPDHRSHVVFADKAVCPASHPVPLPQLSFFVTYPESRGTGQLLLAPLASPSPVHADFLNSWNQEQQARFVRDCIRANVFCGSNPPM